MDKTVFNFMNNKQLLRKDSVVLVGVSGGPDSIALLHFYLSLKVEWNLTIIAVSVDHQLRGAEAKADLQYVKEICAKWDVPFVGTSIDVDAYKREKQISTQLASREVRYKYFEQQMIEHQADYLALGHHGDDQVETVLMGLVRSSSPVALSGIPYKRTFANGFIVRPFLCVTKQMIVDYCDLHAIVPRIDPSNEETDYTRNYFRKEIIPLLKPHNNNIHNTVQQLSENLQMDEQFLQKEAKKAFNKLIITTKQKGNVSFKIVQFLSYPNALQRRIYHLILDYLYDKLPNSLSSVHEQYFFSLLKDQKGNVQIDFPSNLKVEKSYELILLYFQKEPKSHLPFQATIKIPGIVMLPDGSKLVSRYTKQPNKEDNYTYYIPEKVDLPLSVRTRLPGDRMGWSGLKGSKKIKDIFIDDKIRRDKRDLWPIVVDSNDKIVWLIGLRKAPKHQENSSSYIELIYKKDNI